MVGNCLSKASLVHFSDPCNTSEENTFRTTVDLIHCEICRWMNMFEKPFISCAYYQLPSCCHIIELLVRWGGAILPNNINLILLFLCRATIYRFPISSQGRNVTGYIQDRELKGHWPKFPSQFHRNIYWFEIIKPSSSAKSKPKVWHLSSISRIDILLYCTHNWKYICRIEQHGKD